MEGADARQSRGLGQMRCIKVVSAQTAHPTGDKNFVVMQPFPAAVSKEESDPFLMCDEIGPSVSKGRIDDPDSFPVAWHPHIGMDIMTYLKEGTGRHADSLGNRCEFASPGFQWCSVGSGIEHAEGGGTPAGARSHGFQIWVNVPQKNKKDDPRYGTEPPENIPILEYPGVLARLLAGPYASKMGPFQTAQSVQMIDFELGSNVEHIHHVPSDLDNCLLYVYRGSGYVAGMRIIQQQLACLAAEDPAARAFTMASGPEGLGVLLFAGKRIREPICWHGPFVMASKAELQSAFATYQSGNFPPKRVPWDYTRAAAAPRK